MCPRGKRERRLADKVADLLLETIVARGLAPGERLPSERELGEQFGVSRTVVREAVRALAAKGVVDVRTGSGLRVAAVEASAVSESMRLFLRGSGPLPYAKVHGVRSMIEIQGAGGAAPPATAEDHAMLREACDTMAAVLDDVEAASEADVDFHSALARATHNQLYGVMLNSIRDVLLDI